MRFVSIFPVGEKEGALASSVAYYIIEPGKHTGLHSDNVEEIVFVAEGEGEVFSIGATTRLEAGKFIVFPAGTDHDIYAQGTDAMRLLSFFPTTEILSTFQQEIYPVGGNVLSSKPPAPVVTELDPNNLPENFPFSLEDLGMAEAEPDGPRELTQDRAADRDDRARRSARGHRGAGQRAGHRALAHGPARRASKPVEEDEEAGEAEETAEQE